MKLSEKHQKKAISYGFVLDCNQYGHLNKMVMGKRHIWHIIDINLNSIFQTADLINGFYCNHKTYKTFHYAINRKIQA